MTASMFVTSAGVAVPAVTTDQMREIDRIALEEVGPNLYQMMENAGRNLALTVLNQLDYPLPAVSIVVLAGRGSNGGGGICAARHLANRGADVTLVISDPDQLGPVPEQQLRVFGETAGSIARVDDLDALSPGLVVDAIIGYNLGGAPRGPAGAMIDWAEHQSAPVVSLDVPSGIDPTTGEAPGAHVNAAATMTLALPKTGMDVTAVGNVWLGDIGIPGEVHRRVGLDVSPAIFRAGYCVEIRPL